MKGRVVVFCPPTLKSTCRAPLPAGVEHTTLVCVWLTTVQLLWFIHTAPPLVANEEPCSVSSVPPPVGPLDGLIDVNDGPLYPNAVDCAVCVDTATATVTPEPAPARM